MKETTLYLDDEKINSIKLINKDIYEEFIALTNHMAEYCKIDLKDKKSRKSKMDTIDKCFAKSLEIGHIDYSEKDNSFTIKEDYLNQKFESLISSEELVDYYDIYFSSILEIATRLHLDIQRLKANLQPFLAKREIDQDTYGTTDQPIM